MKSSGRRSKVGDRHDGKEDGLARSDRGAQQGQRAEKGETRDLRKDFNTIGKNREGGIILSSLPGSESIGGTGFKGDAGTIEFETDQRKELHRERVRRGVAFNVIYGS